MESYPVDDRGYAPDAKIEEYLGLVPGRLRKLRHAGDAPAFVKIGATVRTSYAAADAWAAERARGGRDRNAA